MKLTLPQFQSELMDIPQVAEYCGFSETRVRQLMDSGKLTYIEVGASKKRLTLRRFVEPHKTPTSIRNKRRGMR